MKRILRASHKTLMFTLILTTTAWAEDSRINAAYNTSIKPIFQKKCFDCHSNKPTFPWYYAVPGVKQLINHDIEEGLEEMDLSKDFPFASKENKAQAKLLKDLKEEIEKGDMPPFTYRIMHTDSKITVEEKLLISRWVDESVELLEKVH